MTLQQVFIINQNLKMSKGKIAVQTAHGEVFYINFISTIMVDKLISPDTSERDNQMLENYTSWTKDGVMKKIVLKATQAEMNHFVWDLKGKIWVHDVHDLGLTQVPENSFTCIVTEPITGKQHQEFFSHLKLL